MKPVPRSFMPLLCRFFAQEPRLDFRILFLLRPFQKVFVLPFSIHVSVSAWKPELHFDENFDIRYIRREDDYVKVRIDYAPPSTWNRDDVTFENTFVRAHDCLETVDQEVFLSSQPDDEGFFTPMVLINESATAIELAFPAKIMFSKCLYSYRVS